MYLKSAFLFMQILISFAGTSSIYTAQGQLARARREAAVGGIENANPNDPEFLQLAVESLQKYLQTTGNTESHKVVEVIKATVQVVAGTITRLDFTVKPLAGHSDDVIKCHSEIWAQPWLHKKDITVDCKINNDRVKREEMTGGIENANPNDPEFLQLAEESLQKYLQTTGNTEPHKVVEVVKATVQVVAGTITRLDFTVKPLTEHSGDVIKCHSEIWAQPWLHKKDITVDCKINNDRVKREEIAGGIENANPNDPKILQLAEESLQKYLQTTGNTEPHKVVEVVKATVQVVAGTITRLDFTVKPLAEHSGDVIKCHSEIWEQPWLHKKDINVDCKINN